MRHLSAGACGLLALAVVLGCGPGKEMPTEVRTSTKPTTSSVDPSGTAPTTSDPAAKAVVERADARIERPERQVAGDLDHTGGDDLAVTKLGRCVWRA